MLGYANQHRMLARHVLNPKLGIYTVSLDDMTIRFSIVEGCDDEENAFWALPTR
jgi:hypothetical protein